MTAHADSVPFTPTEGGVLDLVDRNWRDGQYPEGDILPSDWADGVRAADREFEYGVGPGCLGASQTDGFTQALPPTRLRAVCEALDLSDDLPGKRCCLESLCRDDDSGPMKCLSGLIENAL